MNLPYCIPGPFSSYFRQFVNSTLKKDIIHSYEVNQIGLLEAKYLANHKVPMLSQRGGIPNHVSQLLVICHFIL